MKVHTVSHNPRKENITYIVMEKPAGIADILFPIVDDILELGSQVGELQHYYVSPGSYLWTQGLHNCVDYAFLFVGIVEGGGEVIATCFDLSGWG